MRQLLKIGIGDCIGSLAPILWWILIGKIYGVEYANGFMLSYPMQFIYGLAFSIFITGSIKTELKSGRQYNYSDMGWLLFAMVVLLPAFGVNIAANLISNGNLSYNLSLGLFGTHLLGADWIVYADMRKLQYDGKERESVVLEICWESWRMVTALALGLFLDIETFMPVCTAITVLSSLFVCLRHHTFKNTRFSLKLFCKYSSASIAGNIGMSIIFVFSVGIVCSDVALLTAYNACALCTDTQWDMLNSIDTYATKKITELGWTVSKGQIFKTSILYGLFLILTSVIMGICYSPMLGKSVATLMAVIMLIEMSGFILEAISTVLESYLQICYPSRWLFIGSLFTDLTRFSIQSIFGTVYSISAGCVAACILWLIITLIIYRKAIKSQNINSC